MYPVLSTYLIVGDGQTQVFCSRYVHVIAATRLDRVSFSRHKNTVPCITMRAWNSHYRPMLRMFVNLCETY